MDWVIFVGVAVVLIVLAIVAQQLGWIDLSDKRKSQGSGSSGSGFFGIGDEVFNPARYESQLELDRQSSLPAPAPVPGDGDKGIYDGRIRIDVSGR